VYCVDCDGSAIFDGISVLAVTVIAWAFRSVRR
jgi:hypothetical protein